MSRFWTTDALFIDKTINLTQMKCLVKINRFFFLDHISVAAVVVVVVVVDARIIIPDRDSSHCGGL